MNNIDWRYLRQPLIMFVLSMLIAASMGVIGWQFEAAQEKKYKVAVETLRTTHKQYTDIVNDIDLLKQYRSLYSGYKSSGLIGDERRLSWIESLENTNGVLKLPRLTYNLLPREKFVRPGLKIKSGIVVNSSPMQLSMGLLHEEDLLAVLEGLRLSIKNLFTVDSCSLSRNGSVASSLKTKGINLTSRCTIRWVTINVK
jgi:hypothetical protein